MIVTPFTHERIHKTVWDVHTNRNVFPGLTVCDIHTNENVFPGLTVWDVHKNGNVFLGLTVCDIHTNGNVFLGFTVWDVHTYGNDFLGLPCGMYIATGMIGFRCLAQSHTAPAWVPGGPITDDFWVMQEGHPIAHNHLAMVPNAVTERG